MSRIEEKLSTYHKRWGEKSAASARFVRTEDVISTGILSLDYALGCGGWPCGSTIEVFGPSDAGKSSIIAFSAIREAQKLGHMCGWVAVEPAWDAKWAAKNGINLDELLVTWPDDGMQAFDQAFEMILDPDIKVVILDSIGALLRPSEAEAMGKPSQGGQAGLITWGTKRAYTPTAKNEKIMIYLNQVRDVMNPMAMGGVDSPGGRALRHTCEIRVQLKSGAYDGNVYEKLSDDKILVAREIVAEIKRTKKDEGTGKRAVFTYYSKEFEGHPIGIDKASDVVNTARRMGVLERSGSWINYKDKKYQGEASFGKFLEEAPEEYDFIREKILEKL